MKSRKEWPAATCPSWSDQLPVRAALAERRRLDRVRLHPLEPARVEHERRLRQVPARSDAEARLEQQAAAHVLGRVELELRLRRCRARGLGPLAEHVQQREQRDGAEEREQAAAQPRLPLAAGEVSVALEDDHVGRRHQKLLSAG